MYTLEVLVVVVIVLLVVILVVFGCAQVWVMRTGGVCVCVRATLLLQPDFGVFLRWMWLVLRGMQVQVTCNTDF